MPTTVAIIDDHAVFRDGLRALLEKAGIDPARLRSRQLPPAIEQTGTGRLEFGIAALQ